METSEALIKAGQIASLVRKKVTSKVDVGTPVIDLCDLVEDYIHKKGGKPAFPCNVDIDHVAAHYTSPINDKTTVSEGTLVKIDIGVHVDGHMADTAVTICFEPRLQALADAAESALEEAIKAVKAGVRASDIGAVIEKTIKATGYAPIRNLTGHKMARYVVHAGLSIPNVSSSGSHRLHDGDVYAIEPFTTFNDASGLVMDGPPGNIYLFKKKRKVDGELSKQMLKHIQSNYRTPFASRWIFRKFPGLEGREAFHELQRSKCIYSYPQLVERSRGLVAQAEHTVLVTKDGCLVTTS